MEHSIIDTVKVKVEVEEDDEDTKTGPLKEVMISIKKEDPLDIEDYADVQYYSESGSSSEESEPRRRRSYKWSETDPGTSNRPHVCVQCGSSFTKIHYLIKHHKYRHTLKSPYHCQDCGEQFFRKSYFEKHLKTHRIDFKCHLCNEFNDNNTALLKHQFTYHWEKFMCSFCTTAYFTMSALADHLREEHQDRKTNSSQCQVCGIEISRYSELWTHIERIHKMICHECLESFSSRTELIQHLFEQHHPEHIEADEGAQNQGLRSFFGRCNQCQYVSSSKVLLLKHFGKVHRDSDLDIEIKCRDCEEFFKTSDEVTQHWKGAHQASFLKTIYGRCCLCSQSSSTRGSLIRHFEAKHPRLELDVEIKCKECDEFFKTQYEIRQHSKVTHAESDKPRNIFGRCHICKQLSATKQSLERHFGNRHPGVEYDFEYKCKECDEFFLSVEHLDEHTEAVHANSESDSRGNSFISKGSTVKKEIENHHSESGSSFRQKVSTQKSMNARCYICNQLFKTTYSLNRHFEKLHPGFELDVEYKCDHCDENFKTTEEVRCHSKLVHTEKEDKASLVFGKCNVCKYLSSTKQCLVRHFERRHPGLKHDFDYKCRHCSEFFKTTTDVKQHSKISHAEIKPVEKAKTTFGRCSVCKKVSSTKSNLVKHFKSMHPRRELDFDLKCQHCDEFFKTTGEVEEHLKVVHQLLKPDEVKEGEPDEKFSVFENSLDKLLEVKMEEGD